MKYSVFAILVLKDNNVKCCKNTVNTDVFEGPCAENTVNTVVFGATCKKTVYVSRFFAFFGSTVSVFTVLFDPQRQKTGQIACFWSVFGPLGSKNYWYLQGFVNATLEKHWFWQGFHAFFSCDFIIFCTTIGRSCMLTNHDKTLPPRAHASTMLALPFHDPFTLAASPVCEACQ